MTSVPSLAAIHFPRQPFGESGDPGSMDVSEQRRWVRALWEPLTSNVIEKDCIGIGNIQGDGDYKMVFVDAATDQCRLKLLKGLNIISDSYLSGNPCGIEVYISDPGHAPCVAVAIGASLLVYRNMKPYYRFNLPPHDVNQSEMAVWNAACEQKIALEDVVAQLKNITTRTCTTKITTHTQLLLSCEDEIDRREIFLELTTTFANKLSPANLVITCTTTMKKAQTSELDTDVIIVGTEDGGVYYIDSQAYNILAYCGIDHIPDQMVATGQFEVECRLYVCTRESDVIIVKRNNKGEMSQNIISVTSYVVAMALTRVQLVLATRNNAINFFTHRGKKIATIDVKEQIVDMEAFNYDAKQLTGVLVAFKDRVDLYIDHTLVDSLKLDHGQVVWIKFGRYGREDAVLLIGSTNGGIGVYIFRRTANVSAPLNPVVRKSSAGTPAGSNSRLALARKSKAYVEQSIREKENCQRIWCTYQRDIFMLRLQITKAFAQLTANDATGLLPTKDSERMDIHTEVLGFGPDFVIRVDVTPSVELPAHKRWLGFEYDREEYVMEKELVAMPPLKPGVKTSFALGIQCIYPEHGVQGKVRAFILSESRKTPIWQTRFEMPVSEPESV